MIEIATGIVGAEDNSSAWWTEFSDYFPLPQGKRLVLEFYNFGKGVDNWNNFNLCVASGERDSDGYAEFFVIRSDTYGWGNSDYNGALFKNEFPDVDGDGDIWNDFRTLMQGAYVTVEIDYAVAGTVFVITTAVATDGTVLRQTYEQPVTGTELVAFLVADGSHMNMESAYLIPSQIEEIPDEVATSITVRDTPVSIELGETEFWGNGVATVTFADGSTTVADTADVTFVVPDLSTPGTKTVIYSYSKTKQGNYGPAVAGTYSFEVTNPVVSIAAVANAYVVGGAKYVTLSPGAVEVEATHVDGSKSYLATSQYTVEFKDDNVVFAGAPATHKEVLTVTFTTASGTELTAKGDVVIMASDQAAQEPKLVGLEDNTTPWWAHFSKDWAVAPNTSQTVSMTVGSNCLNNWHSPCTILWDADHGEYAVVRMDNYGWDGVPHGGYGTAVLTSNWNWDIYAANQDGASVSITVSNNGDNTANIRYHVVYKDGSAFFQYFDGITVNSADLSFACVVEGAHLIFD